MNKIRKYYPSDVVRRVIHELSVVGLKGTECKVEGKLAVKCVASEHLSLLFFIGARGWVLTDTSGYVNKDTSTGELFNEGITLLQGRLKHHRGEKKRLKANNKRQKAYKNPTPQQTLSKLKNFEKYYKDGYSISKSAKMANVDYKTAKAYLAGDLDLSVN